MKSHNATKTERGSLCDFSRSILSQNLKKIEGGLFGDFFPEKMFHNAEKNSKVGPFSLARYCMLREKTFLTLFAKPNGSI